MNLSAKECRGGRGCARPHGTGQLHDAIHRGSQGNQKRQHRRPEVPPRPRHVHAYAPRPCPGILRRTRTCCVCSLHNSGPFAQHLPGASCSWAWDAHDTRGARTELTTCAATSCAEGSAFMYMATITSACCYADYEMCHVHYTFTPLSMGSDASTGIWRACSGAPAAPARAAASEEAQASMDQPGAGRPPEPHVHLPDFPPAACRSHAHVALA